MDRKQLIKDLQLKYETKAKYLGVPSCAYEITLRGITYTVDKEGKIVTPNGQVIDPEDLLNERAKVIAESEEIASDPNETQEDTTLEIMSYEIKLPMEGHSGKTLRNLINMIYAKQPLILKALAVNDALLTESFVQAINETDMETISDFEAALAQIETSRLEGLQIDFEEKTFTFNLDLEPDKVEAAISLLALINKNALSQNNASFKAKPTSNEKYTFRTWLLRLGMIGDEYKKTRKVLLGNLSGNGAFRISNKEGENVEA
ncbi:hypothetical protein J2Z35_002695 [Acetoanaerobium pronyense]|uniref:Virulence-related protein n=1 Tax=Acetoanaerobium pronyense TaxID=1482736 RepID=A0ABS4KM49_9FIRM|nr:virulence-related protein [Acetoanaerobium pronyense]MBP2028857.1 hypothetical protein [Acetoanaerobium pronyense]